MEGSLCIGGQLVELFQQRELLGLQRIAAWTKEVQGLTVAEEDRLLAFVDDEL